MNLALEPKPSRIQIGATWFVGLCALSGLWQLGLDPLVGGVFTFAIAISCLHQTLWICGKLKSSILRLELLGNDWWLRLGDGRMLKAQLVGSRIILPSLVGISFSIDNKRVPCLLMKDSLTVTEHRRLRSAVLQYPIEDDRWYLAVARWYQDRVSRVRRE